MKRLFYFFILLVWALTVPAQENGQAIGRIVSYPEFKVRSGSIYTITKVKLTDEYTKIFAHVVFRPHWWICPDSAMYLEDVATGVRYRATGIEGMKFGERFFMPDSGETDAVFIFPPLPDDVKVINWIDPTSDEDRTYGIDLTKDGDGKSLPDKREEWLAQYVQTETPADEVDASFFVSDTVRITGLLDHYDPVLGFNTGIVYVQDMLQNKDRPAVVTIHPDGRLEGKFLLRHPLHAYMVIGNNYTIGEVYLEPGKTLSLYIDFEDLLARSRARDAFYPLRHIMYGGSLGEVNRQLAEAPVFPLDYEDLKAMSGKLAPMQVRGECDRAVAAWSKALEKYMDEKQVSPKARRILEIQEKVSGALWLLDYAMIYERQLAQDTANAVKKDSLPMQYFSFLRSVPLDDEKILSVESGATFVNRFSFMGWLWKQAEEKIVTERKTHLKSGTEPSAGAVLIPDKVRTEILMEYLDSTHIPFLWQLVLCNSVCATLDYASGDIAAKADSSSVRRMTALKNSISEMITHPVLKQTLEDVYYQYGKKQAYQLPPCEGTDVFRKLTEPYQGKILLVDFWSISCAPCRLAIEKHADLRAKYRNHKDVQFIFITSEGESPEQPYKEYVEKHLKGEAVYRIPSSDYQRLRELFSFNGIPRYVLIGRNGEVLSDDYRNLYSVQVLEKDLKALGVDVDSVNEIKP